MGYLNKRLSEKELYLSLANRPRKANTFSKYRGVVKSGRPAVPYRAVVQYQGRKYFLGDYSTEIEAARRYNEQAPKIIGDYALLNDLNGQ